MKYGKDYCTDFHIAYDTGTSTVLVLVVATVRVLLYVIGAAVGAAVPPTALLLVLLV